jgi:hypothetical protein
LKEESRRQREKEEEKNQWKALIFWNPAVSSRSEKDEQKKVQKNFSKGLQK